MEQSIHFEPCRNVPRLDSVNTVQVPLGYNYKIQNWHNIYFESVNLVKGQAQSILLEIQDECISRVKTYFSTTKTGVQDILECHLLVY